MKTDTAKINTIQDSCCSVVEAAGESSVLSAKDLSIRYGKKTVLKNVSLTIYENKITALIGPSGCGKTSFLNSLNRMTDMIPGCKVEGLITCCGSNIHQPLTNLVSLRRRVGMIFQKPNPFPMSIQKNIVMPLHEHGVRDKEKKEQILQKTLQDVGLWDEVKDRLAEPALALSGGQQQRLCIARAIALEPRILLMDEPCSALDPIASGKVEDLIVSLREHYSLVVVTHNLAQARRIADTVAVFWTRSGVGQVIEQGSAQTVFENPQDSDAAAFISGQRG